MSYHNVINRIASRSWDEVCTNIQLSDAPDKDMPRLLFECIHDLTATKTLLINRFSHSNGCSEGLMDAERFANISLEEHDLARDGWAFTWLPEPAWLLCGQCDYNLRQIMLSPEHACRSHVADVHDTILHEVAHALAGWAAGHGPEWEAQCRAVGARTPDGDTVRKAWLKEYMEYGPSRAGRGHLAYCFSRSRVGHELPQCNKSHRRP